MKKATIFLLALLLCGLPAMAESGVYAGEVVAAREVNVLAPADGAIESYALQVGERVAAGAPVAFYETEKVYATGDGTVAAVWAGEGEEIDGTLVEIEPIGKYIIYCTVEGGYATMDNYFVRAGETVYIKCTEDGTHRGTGIVTSVDGEEYMVTTTGGEFYVGETVYLYRDADFTYSQKIGVGTLIYADNTLYEANGTVLRLYVQAGNRVERGQLLYETLGCAQTEVTAPVSGIVASVGGTETSDAAASTQSGDVSSGTAAAGQTDGAQSTAASQASEAETTSASDSSVSEGDTLAVLYPADSILVEIAVPEEDLGRIAVGQAAEVVFADDPDAVYAGTVLRISNIADDDGSYRAQVSVEREDLSIGMTCDVIVEQELAFPGGPCIMKKKGGEAREAARGGG